VAIPYNLRKSSEETNLNNILVPQFSKVFDFTDGRHVKAVFEKTDFDLFNGYFAASSNLSSCVKVKHTDYPNAVDPDLDRRPHMYPRRPFGPLP
jgi:hypothetical protein